MLTTFCCARKKVELEMLFIMHYLHVCITLWKEYHTVETRLKHLLQMLCLRIMVIDQVIDFEQ